jgi:hypothetical protein
MRQKRHIMMRLKRSTFEREENLEDEEKPGKGFKDGSRFWKTKTVELMNKIKMKEDNKPRRDTVEKKFKRLLKNTDCAIKCKAGDNESKRED